MLRRRKKPLSKALPSSSSSDSAQSDERSTPPNGRHEDSSSSSSSIEPHRRIYNEPRSHTRQFWMTASLGSVVNLMGYAFRHGRPAPLIHLAKMLYNEPAVCGFEAPLRGLIFAAVHHRLSRRLLADLAVCAVPLDPLVRTGALLESLLVMLQNQLLTHELEPITNWSDAHVIDREVSRKANPILAIFHGYIALQRLRELTKLQADPEMLSGNLTKDERGFCEVALAQHRALAQKSLKGALCVPGVVGDVFLQIALLFEQMDNEFSFQKILKLYIRHNPDHLTGFLYYYQLLRQRQDVNSSIRRLACIRKILSMSPADTVALEYAETILELGEIADFQDVSERLALYLDHWERRTCLRGWRLLAASLILAKKYNRSVDIMSQRKFWWKYHFSVNFSNCDPVVLVKAVIVSMLTGPESPYVCAARAAAISQNDGRLEHALKVADDPENFRLAMFIGIAR